MDSSVSHNPDEVAQRVLILPAVLAIIGSGFLFSDRSKLQAAAPIILSTSLAYSLAHHLNFKNHKE